MFIAQIRNYFFSAVKDTLRGDETEVNHHGRSVTVDGKAGSIFCQKSGHIHIIEHRGACLNCEIFTPAGRTRPSPPWKLGPRNLLILRHTTTLSPSARMFRSEIELNYVIAGCPREIMTDTENAFEIALFATFH